MLLASVLAHIALGCTFGLFFVIYYINGDGKAKLFFESLLGIGGNIGGIFILYNTFKIDDVAINLISIASCLFSFLFITVALVIILAFVIKDEENDKNNIIRIRDIIIGQTSWVKEFRDLRMKEIDGILDYENLKKREEKISQQESIIDDKQKFVDEELKRLDEIGKQKVRMSLPEKSNITVSKEFVDLMPSYFKDVVRCITEMNTLEQEYLENAEEFDINTVKSYLYALASSISSNIFSNNSVDIRIHFRYYNKEKKGYDKLIAIKGNQIISQDMTFIPYSEDNMIVKSYECKRALIKSINYLHDFQSDNHVVWKDYLTYTFHDLKSEGIPYLSFGISVKNEIRYKKVFYYLNYVNFEEYLQEKIEILHTKYKLEHILYGGDV